LAGLNARLLQSLVDRDTGTEDRRNGSEVALLGDASNMGRFGDAVLLESAVDSVSRELGFRAERLIRGLAEVAGQAGAVQPFDASVIADLDVFDEIADGNDDTGTLVATDER